MTDLDLGPLHDRCLNAVGQPHTCNDVRCECRVRPEIKNPLDYVPAPEART